MSIGHKSSHLQAFRLMVYQRALHPELFELQGRQLHRHGDYEAEIWIWPAGHTARFQVDGECVTETVVEDGDHLPETGLVHALPCLGEKDFELQPDGRIGYVTTIQTEALTDNLYRATYGELRDFSEESHTLFHEWTSEDDVACLSLLDVQKYKSEFHIQSYHMMGESGLVLRTQSIFEIK